MTLARLRPAIWRRLHVPDIMTLAEIHRLIQAAMGWGNCHLHVFEIDSQSYGDRRTMDDVKDEKKLMLASLVKSGINRFNYTYDVGDNWECALLIEKIRPVVDVATLPLCVAGKRAGPPEDCGGIWGYGDLIEVLADPDHPEHAERLEWFGRVFDPEAFDIAIVNARIKAAFGRARS